MPGENLFPHLWRLVCELEQQRVVTWSQLTTPEAVRERQRWIRETTQRMIGPFPTRCDLNPRVVKHLDRPDYRLELVIFDSRPDFPVTATLYLPKRGDGPHPAVVLPCGHSANGRLAETYQRAQIALVKQGYVVLSYDPISQGERVQYLNALPRLAGCCHEHCMAGNQLNLTGGNLANIRIWDGMRAHDYLLTRPEVDPRRVAVTGNSGGGTLSAYLLCFDDRYAAGAPSCYITTLVHRIATRMAADSEQQFVPMLREGIDHADLLLPAAPQPVLICAAKKDFFPIEGARRTHADLQRLYEILGAPERLGLCEADEQHGFTRPLREGMVRWFNRWLRQDESPYQEPDFPLEEDATLYCTTTGQVMTSDLGAASIHQVVQRDFPVKLACRTAADPLAAVRAKLPELLGIDPAAADRPWPRPFWPVEKETLPPGPAGVRVEPVQFLSDFDVDLQGYLFTPRQVTAGATVLVPDLAGCAPLLERGSRAYELALAGRQVLALDVRGVGSDRGELPPWASASRYYDFYGIEVDLTYTSFMVGRPLLGQRTFDVLCAAHWLRQRGQTVSLEGHGEGALLALLAAALDPGVTAVSCRRMLLSWQRLFTTEVYDYLPTVVVPDALLHLDLPDVAAILAPRPLALVEPVDATRRPVSVEEARREYAPAVRAYAAAGQAAALTFVGAER